MKGNPRAGLVLAAIPLVLGLGWTALTPVIYSNMFPHALTGIAATFAATLAVYGIVRAIGWVIGGLAASLEASKAGEGKASGAGSQSSEYGRSKDHPIEK